MKLALIIARGRRQLREFSRDERGISAVEFAMLLPLMVTLYLGAVEISQGVSINRKVTLTARTVADLASQVSSINNSDMTNLLNAAASVAGPVIAASVTDPAAALSRNICINAFSRMKARARLKAGV